ncbi:hypothetical protein ABPG74_003838 [Tetrahymena malaccensis]
MNFDKRLNDQQRRNQIRKNQTNLPLTKKGQIEIQKFNSQQVQNLKDKEIMQETSFLGSNRSVNNQQMSFFEEQYTILKNSDLQEQYLISFFEKMKNDQGLSEVDYRILNSLL